MPTHVRTPDGGTAIFPDGMSDAAIETVLRREFPAPKSAKAPPATPRLTAPTPTVRTEADLPPALRAEVRARRQAEAARRQPNALASANYGPQGRQDTFLGRAEQLGWEGVDQVTRGISALPDAVMSGDPTGVGKSALDIGGGAFHTLAALPRTYVERTVGVGAHALTKHLPMVETPIGPTGGPIDPEMVGGAVEAAGAAALGPRPGAAPIRPAPAYDLAGRGRYLPSRRPVPNSIAATHPVPAPQIPVKPAAPSFAERPALAPVYGQVPVRPLARGVPPRPAAAPASAADLTAARALRRNIAAGGQTIEQYRAALDANPHALPLHVNTALTKLGGVIAQGSGPGAAHITDAIDSHRLSVPEQMAEAIATAHGARGEDIVASMARQQKERSAAFKEGLAKIGDDMVTLGPDITEPLAADIHKAPLQNAAQIALGHTNPAERGFGKALAGVIEKLHGETSPSEITLRVSDAQALKRGLATAADAGFSSVADSAAKLRAPTFKNMASAVRDAVAAQHPAYAELLKKYGDDSSALDAQKVGYKGLFGNTMADSPAGQAAALGALHGGPEVIQAAHAQGTMEALVMAANRTGDIQAIRSVLKGRDGRAQLAMAIGKDKADALISSLDGLKKHHEANNSIVGNSATFGRAATAEAEREAEQSVLSRLADAAASIPHTPMGAAIYAGKAGLKALARADHSVIGDAAANEAIGKALADRTEAERLLSLVESKKP